MYTIVNVGSNVELDVGLAEALARLRGVANTLSTACLQDAEAPTRGHGSPARRCPAGDDLQAAWLAY